MAPNHPSGHGGRRKRRRGRRGQGGSRPGQAAANQQQAPQNTSTISQQGPPARRGGSFTGPMDHSYRSGQAQSQGRGRGFQARQFVHAEIEPLPPNGDENATPRIFAFIDDLFFTAKVQETSRKLNVKVQFVKTDKDVLEHVNGNGGEKPSLIIFDLNNVAAKPLTTAPKLKSKLKKGTTIIGFLSHLQADLKAKAIEAGFDMVVPRSAFSQNLPSLLRRHATDQDGIDA